MNTSSKILLIGGTDPSGAGLQTDWQVAHYLQVQANSVVTAVTSQSSEGVLNQGILLYQQVKSQLRMLGDTPFSAIKIGMLGNECVVKAVVNFIKKQPAETAIILDPVLESSSGGALINHKGLKVLCQDLLPLVTLITPNINELEALTGISVHSYSELESATQALLKLGAKSVFVKGGHFQTEEKASIDYFAANHTTDICKLASFYLKGQRWEGRKNVRGTGCATATAIASSFSQGHSLTDAIVFAKALISNGIRYAVHVDEQLKLRFLHQHKANPFNLDEFPTLFQSSKSLNTIPKFTQCDTQKLGIYPVVDTIEWLKKLVPLGISTLQIRIKDQRPEDVEDELIKAINYGHERKVRLFINDYWQLAVKHKAYGIHLGQEDLDALSDDDLHTIAKAGCRLGISTHCYTEVTRAHALKPSYLAFGPIFSTTSKDMPWIPQGVAAVQNWVGLLGSQYPMVAIGGINKERAIALKETGIGSVAMITAITEADDYVRETEALLKLWDK